MQNAVWFYITILFHWNCRQIYLKHEISQSVSMSSIGLSLENHNNPGLSTLGSQFLFQFAQQRRLLTRFRRYCFSMQAVLLCVIIYVSMRIFSLWFSLFHCSILIYTNKYISGYYTVILLYKLLQWQKWVNSDSMRL